MDGNVMPSHSTEQKYISILTHSQVDFSAYSIEATTEEPPLYILGGLLRQRLGVPIPALSISHSRRSWAEARTV